jgi:AraC-like DNA-binding protein
MKSQFRPVQPSLVLGASYFYKMPVMDVPFSHFYQFERTDDDCIVAFPDGTFDIIFECGHFASKAFVYGSVLKGELISFKKGVTYFGMRLLPGFVPNQWRRYFPQLISGSMPGESLGIKTASITCDMDFHQKIDNFLESFPFRYSTDSSDYLFDYSMKLISKTNGNILMGELEEKTGYSTRYINAIFHRNIGISPKTFCLFMKFQQSLLALINGEFYSVSDIANAMGYYDQSAFISDFKRFTTFTPKQFQLTIKKNSYKSLIINY